MNTHDDFLIEIGTEELPPKALKLLAESFAQNMQKKLSASELAYQEITYYATPRRLALLIKQLEAKQKNRSVERRGPALRAAFDADGKPTPALLGFVKSCSVTLTKLEKLETDQGSWMIYRYTETGKTVQELLPTLINEAIAGLPIPKPMRWGATTTQFIRPVHWITMLYGKQEVTGIVLGHHANRITYGHRFHHPQAIILTHANEYAAKLQNEGHVIVDFAARKQMIRQQIETLATHTKAQAHIEEDLLDEVTGLVEWPVALLAEFDDKFLNVPAEALISAMQHHQKSFPLLDANNKLLAKFILISNIESKIPEEVIHGNERVMRARLSDAKFFYDADRKHKLADRLENLKTVVFQAKLGTLYEKSERIATLAKSITKQTELAARAGLLCKADLCTNMVSEFPELQGVMGYYYALNDGENNEVAVAIRDHYRPRFAKDELPATALGCAVALADRIDTLVGIFGINQQPTGDKDPFGLRRAALGILRIIIEHELDLDLHKLLETAKDSYKHLLPNSEVVPQVYNFISERLRAWYLDKNITTEVVAAVLVKHNPRPLDIHHRIYAVQAFQQLPEAMALAAANKRVSNLLNKSQLAIANHHDALKSIDAHLFNHDAERNLYQAVLTSHKNKAAAKQQDYKVQLLALASLQKPVDEFFDKVLVMDENEKLRNNRLALLAALRNLFLEIADISLLQN